MRFFNADVFSSRFYRATFYRIIFGGDVEAEFNIVEEMDDIVFVGTAEEIIEADFTIVEEMDDIIFVGTVEEVVVVPDHRDLLPGSPIGRAPLFEERPPIRAIFQIAEEQDRISARVVVTNRISLTVIEIHDKIEFRVEAAQWTGAHVALIEGEDGFEARLEVFDVIGRNNLLLLTLLLDDD